MYLIRLIAMYEFSRTKYELLLEVDDDYEEFVIWSTENGYAYRMGFVK